LPEACYDVTKKIAGEFEYYDSVGSATDFDPVAQQMHQLFPAIDLNLSPKWEVNFGVGVDVTRSTDQLITKMISAVVSTSNPSVSIERPGSGLFHSFVRVLTFYRNAPI
jgi:hypothetical protein